MPGWEQSQKPLDPNEAIEVLTSTCMAGRDILYWGNYTYTRAQVRQGLIDLLRRIR